MRIRVFQSCMAEATEPEEADPDEADPDEAYRGHLSHSECTVQAASVTQGGHCTAARGPAITMLVSFMMLRSRFAIASFAIASFAIAFLPDLGFSVQHPTHKHCWGAQSPHFHPARQTRSAIERAVVHRRPMSPRECRRSNRRLQERAGTLAFLLWSMLPDV